MIVLLPELINGLPAEASGFCETEDASWTLLFCLHTETIIGDKKF